MEIKDDVKDDVEDDADNDAVDDTEHDKEHNAEDVAVDEERDLKLHVSTQENGAIIRHTRRWRCRHTWPLLY